MIEPIKISIDDTKAALMQELSEAISDALEELRASVSRVREEIPGEFREALTHGATSSLKEVVSPELTLISDRIADIDAQLHDLEEKVIDGAERVIAAIEKVSTAAEKKPSWFDDALLVLEKRIRSKTSEELTQIESKMDRQAEETEAELRVSYKVLEKLRAGQRALNEQAISTSRDVTAIKDRVTTPWYRKVFR